MSDGAPAGKLPGDLGAAQMGGRPKSHKSALKNGWRTHFLIAKYQELNPLVGMKGGFQQVHTLSVNFEIVKEINVIFVCLSLSALDFLFQTKIVFLCIFIQLLDSEAQE